MILPFDVIVASEKAKFGMLFIKVGLVPELASTHFLVQRDRLRPRERDVPVGPRSTGAARRTRGGSPIVWSRREDAARRGGRPRRDDRREPGPAAAHDQAALHATPARPTSSPCSAARARCCASAGRAWSTRKPCRPSSRSGRRSSAERPRRHQAGAVAKQPTYWLTRFVLLRLLGVVYFFAFLSLAGQVLPLVGDARAPAGGRVPRTRLAPPRTRAGAASWRCPSLFWLGVSGSALLAGSRVARVSRSSVRSCWRASPTRPAGGAVGALHVVRPRRADLLRLRLGDPAARDGLPRDLPLPARSIRARSRAAPPPSPS